jgi:inosine/xanthosine triphosphate pyrophosphatase family protein
MLLLCLCSYLHLQNTVLKEKNKVCGTIFVPKRGEVFAYGGNFIIYTACLESLGSEVKMAVMVLAIYCTAWTEQ